MPLLDYNPDPLAQGLLGLGASLMTPRALGGGMGAGLLAFNQGAMQAQQARRQMAQDALREQLMKSQIAESESQIEARRAALEDAKRRQAYLERWMQGNGPSVDQSEPAKTSYAPGSALSFGGDAFGSALMPGAESQYDNRPVTVQNVLGQSAVSSQPAQRQPSLRDALELKLRAGIDVADIVRHMNNPVKYEGGSVYETSPGSNRFISIPKLENGQVYDMSGGGVSTAPGYLTSTGDINRTVEAAKIAGQLPGTRQLEEQRAIGRAAGEVLEVTRPDGTKEFVPKSSVVGGGQSRAAPIVSNAITNSAAAGRDATLEGNKLFVKDILPKVRNDAANARLTVAQLRAVEALNSPTGWGVEGISKLGGVLMAFGVAPDSLKGLTSNVQVFNKFVNDQVLLAQIAQAGPQTESDAQRMRATLAQIGNTKEANQMIIDFMRAGAELKVAKAKFYSDAARLIEAGRTSAAEIEGLWEQKAPSLWDTAAMARWRSREGLRGNSAEIPR